MTFRIPAILSLILIAAPARAKLEDQPSPAPASEPPAAETQPPAPTPRTDASGRTLFERAASVLRDAQWISYHVKSYGVGDLYKRTGRVIEADVRQGRAPGGILPGWRLRMTGTSTPVAGQVPPQEFDVAWVLVTVEWLDHENRRLVEKNYQEARRARIMSLVNPARLDDMTSHNPFQKELAGEHILEGVADLNGETCDVVLVLSNQGRTRTRWWFARSDGLPRKRELLLESSAGTSSSIIEFSEMRVDVSPPSAAAMASLRVPLPEGYTEDRPPPVAHNPNGMDGIGLGATPDPGKQPVLDEKNGEGTPAEVPSVPPTPVEPPRPALAPDFDLRTPEGERITRDSLRGRVVIFEFAGSWAVNLRSSRPELGNLLARYRDRPVRAFSLAVRERSVENALEGFRGAPEGLTLLLDADATAVAFGAGIYPAYGAMGPEGEIIFAPRAYVPGTTIEELAQAVDAALQKMESKP
jgi:hypothetical protein